MAGNVIELHHTIDKRRTVRCEKKTITALMIWWSGYKRMNAFYVAATSILWVMYLCYLWLKRMNSAIAAPTVYCNTVLILIFIVINIVLYCRNKGTKHLQIISAVEIGVEYLLLGVQTDAEFISYTMAGILALQIPYYDKKNFKKVSIGYFILALAVIVVRTAKGEYLTSVDDLCKAVSILLLLFVLMKVGQIAKEFSDHALGAIGDQQEKDRRIFESVVAVSKTIHEESVRSGSLVDELVKTTESVANSMREISESSNTTAGSIEEQNNMTQSIQSAIGKPVSVPVRWWRLRRIPMRVFRKICASWKN